MPTTPSLPEPFVDVAAIADLLQVSRSWVYENAAHGNLPHYRVGRYLRFKTSEVVAWVGEQRTRNDWLEGQRQGAGRRP
jgi:excisionase family DNA binding protein